MSHLADYVLTWTNGNGDDLSKLNVMATIANEIYKGVCNNTCEEFTVLDGVKEREYSDSVKNTILYRMASNAGGLNKYSLVYSSPHGKVQCNHSLIHTYSLFKGACFQSESSFKEIKKMD